MNTTTLRRAMSRFTVANLPRLDAAALAEQLRAPKTTDNNNNNNSIAVIDVRDGDHIGGHIKGSRWVPSHQFDEWLPTLLRQLESTNTVVFHCALSKQRGPSAALKYIRAREGQYGTASVQGPQGGDHPSGEEANDQADPASTTTIAQKVCVLRGGFQKWQEAYGPDEQLTEAYVKDLWEDY